MKVKLTPQKLSSPRSRQRGLSLLEVLLSLGLLAGAMVGLNSMYGSYAEDLRVAQTAEQLKTHAQAYRRYIRDNRDTLWADTSGNRTVLIRYGMLTAGGYLPPGGSNLNVFGQSTCALVMQTNGNLQALVVTEEGQAINNVDLASVVSMAGASAGAIYDSGDGKAPDTVRGALGNWQIPLATYDNKTTATAQRCSGASGNVRLEAGRLAYALWYEDTGTQSGALFRDAIPGASHLNRMNTPLILNSAQVANTACTTPGAISNDASGAVVSCTGGLWQRSASGLFWGDAVDTLAALPPCTNALRGSTRMVRTVTAPAIQPSAYTCNGNTWQALAIDAAGNLNVPGTLTAGAGAVGTLDVNQLNVAGSGQAGSACDRPAAVSRSITGDLLVCNTKPGSGPVWVSVNGALQCRNISSSDLNLFLPNLSEFVCGQGAQLINAPIAGEWFYVTTQRHHDNNGFAVQTATTYSNNRIFTRQQSGGNWTVWTEMTQTDLTARARYSACNVNRDMLAREAGSENGLLVCGKTTGVWDRMAAGVNLESRNLQYFLRPGAPVNVDTGLSCRDWTTPSMIAAVGTNGTPVNVFENVQYSAFCNGPTSTYIVQAFAAGWDWIVGFTSTRRTQ